MKILILGARGMLGNDIAQVMADYKPILWDREELDITDNEQVDEALDKLKPEIIINAAAYTDVEKAEDEPEIAKAVNGRAVGLLAKTSRRLTAVLVHLSTEYVFAGDNQAGYYEDDKPEPINAYGRSKLLGEQELLSSKADFYLVRTSWLYGHSPQRGKARGKNFIETILDKAKGGNQIKVVNDQHGRPTFTKDVASKIRDLIDNKLPYGIYHAVNEGETTWFGLAEQALRFSGVGGKIVPCSSREYPTKAKRPRYSLLNNTKLPKLRSWREALDEYMSN